MLAPAAVVDGGAEDAAPASSTSSTAKAVEKEEAAGKLVAKEKGRPAAKGRAARAAPKRSAPARRRVVERASAYDLGRAFDCM